MFFNFKFNRRNRHSHNHRFSIFSVDQQKQSSSDRLRIIRFRLQIMFWERFDFHEIHFDLHFIEYQHFMAEFICVDPFKLYQYPWQYADLVTIEAVFRDRSIQNPQIKLQNKYNQRRNTY